MAEFLPGKPDFNRNFGLFWPIIANNHEKNSIPLTKSINFSQEISISCFVLPRSWKNYSALPTPPLLVENSKKNFVWNLPLVCFILQICKNVFLYKQIVQYPEGKQVNLMEEYSPLDHLIWISKGCYIVQEPCATSYVKLDLHSNHW